VPSALIRASTLSSGTLSTLSVKLRRPQPEHILSALPPLATEERTFGIGSFVPKAVLSRCNKLRCYSITSSARASSVGGTSRPSAFAVLRLMTSSNLVGCITGKSAGLSPLRILPT
jgi:hypothetical protein